MLLIFHCRTKLCFWAGSPTSEVRKNLRVLYKGLEEFEFHFVENVKRAFVLDTFQKEIRRSKFCVCPRGKTQVGGVCLAESMAFGCVPGKNASHKAFLLFLC